jgi:hypothetical protein
MSKISTDPAKRKAVVDKYSVYLKPSLYKILARTLEINEAIYQNKFGKKFISSVEKQQAKDNGKDQETDY